MASSSHDGWDYLPSEILTRIGPLLHLTIDMPYARLACSHWAYSLTHCIVRIQKDSLKGAGPKDWGKRMLSGLQELKWSAPRSLRCAPWGSLRRLTLTKARITSISLRVVFSCAPPLLEHLDISGSNVTDYGFVGSWPPSLSSLNLSGCSKITDAALRTMGHIKSLVIDHCQGLNGSGIRALQNIESLSVRGPDIVDWAGFMRTRNLTSLNATRVAATLTMTVMLSYVSSLTSLTLGEESKASITDLALYQLRDLPFLSRLTLIECDGLRDFSITSLRSLDYISISSCDAIEAKELAPLTRLSELSLIRCCAVGDAGLAELGRMPSLTSLHVSGCEAITGAGLQSLMDARPDLLLTV